MVKLLTWICRFHGQLWIPLPGTYTFKLQATRAASLFIGNDRVLNSSGRLTVGRIMLVAGSTVLLTTFAIHVAAIMLRSHVVLQLLTVWHRPRL